MPPGARGGCGHSAGDRVVAETGATLGRGTFRAAPIEGVSGLYPSCFLPWSLCEPRLTAPPHHTRAPRPRQSAFPTYTHQGGQPACTPTPKDCGGRRPRRRPRPPGLGRSLGWRLEPRPSERPAPGPAGGGVWVLGARSRVLRCPTAASSGILTLFTSQLKCKKKKKTLSPIQRPGKKAVCVSSMMESRAGPRRRAMALATTL